MAIDPKHTTMKSKLSIHKWIFASLFCLSAHFMKGQTVGFSDMAEIKTNNIKSNQNKKE